MMESPDGGHRGGWGRYIVHFYTCILPGYWTTKEPVASRVANRPADLSSRFRFTLTVLRWLIFASPFRPLHLAGIKFLDLLN
jgi:hypothetical protein